MARVTNRLGWWIAGVLAVALLATIAGVIQAGPLDPPGPPGSTLPQVEPRIPISSLPYVITQPGSYFVTNHLAAGAPNGITVSANDVEIDLNGFTMNGAGATDGITDNGNARSNITVRNGVIREWGGDGINLGASSNVHIADITADYNEFAGIETGSGIVKDCVVRAYAGGLVGIRAWGNATISNCHVEGYGTGIALNAGGVITDSVAVGADLTGIYGGSNATIMRSRVSDVGIGGAGPNNGITVEGGSLVKDNAIWNVSDSASPDNGVSVSGASNTVTGNTIGSVELGIRVWAGAMNSKIYENSLAADTPFDAGSWNDGDEIGPTRPYPDGRSWDQQLSAAGATNCRTPRFNCVFDYQAVLDRETGLVWQRNVSTETAWYWGAYQGCLAATTGNRRGWRLPKIEELMSLSTPGQTPSLPVGHPFTGVNTGAYYWSATTAPYQFPENGYSVRFSDGHLSGARDKNSSQPYWCVRGGQGYDATYEGTP